MLTDYSTEPKLIRESLLLMNWDYEDKNQLGVLRDLTDQLSRPVMFKAKIHTRPPQALTFA